MSTLSRMLLLDIETGTYKIDSLSLICKVYIMTNMSLTQKIIRTTKQVS